MVLVSLVLRIVLTQTKTTKVYVIQKKVELQRNKMNPDVCTFLDGVLSWHCRLRSWLDLQCRSNPNLGTKSSFIDGCLLIDTIRSHWESPGHIKKLAAQNVRNAEEGPLDIIVNRLGEKNKEIWGYTFNTTYTVLNHEMAFTAFLIMLK